MIETEPLSKDEQDLFNSMRDEKEPPAKDADAGKEAADKAAKEASDKVAKDAKDAADKSNAEKKDGGHLGSALKEAREQNKTLHKELDTMKALVAAGDTKLQKFMQEVAKKAEAAAPKFEDDPAGALKAENAALKKGLEEVQKRLEAQDQASKGANELQTFAAKVTASEMAFAKEHPDYWKAAEYVAAAWRDEFSETGFDETEIPQRVFQKSLGLTHRASQAGKDPAEAIWNIAKRLGFKQSEAKSEVKAEAKDDAKTGKTNGEAKLETLQKGQSAAKVNGGGSGPDDLTLSSLAQMDDDQIEKLVSDPDWWAKNVRRTPLH